MPPVLRRASRLIALGTLIASAGPFGYVRAQELGANALVDFGMALTSDERSFSDGGLGKLEYGNGGRPALATGQALADLRLEPTDSLGAFATVRAAPDQQAPLDVLEAYARYQPVSNTTWLWSMKGGAFFPPISLENEGIGWTSPWTITSSAINSWVGDELRTIGGENDVEWRYSTGALGATAAVFGENSPAGALLADRGWVFDSRPAGLFGEPRLPDVLAHELGDPTPLVEEPFKQIGGNPGWYAGASARADGIGRIALLYYDNEADPRLHEGTDFAWRTKFTSLGAEADVGNVVLLSQAMFGETTIAPTAAFSSTTDFQSAYVLAGYYFGQFRLAGRVDVFATQQQNEPGGGAPGEHGYALTAAGTWAPQRWLHLTAEMLYVDSDRDERALAGLPPHAAQLQGQLVARFLY
jgi:hypothetical protein